MALGAFSRRGALPLRGAEAGRALVRTSRKHPFCRNGNKIMREVEGGNRRRRNVEAPSPARYNSNHRTRNRKAARMNLGSESETVEFKKSTGEHKEALQAISAMLCQKVKTQAQT